MGYSKEIWRKALQTLDASRARAQNEADARRAALYDAIPQMRSIDRALASTGLDAAKAAISGGDQAPMLIERLRAQNGQGFWRRPDCPTTFLRFIMHALCATIQVILDKSNAPA